MPKKQIIKKKSKTIIPVVLTKGENIVCRSPEEYLLHDLFIGVCWKEIDRTETLAEFLAEYQELCSDEANKANCKDVAKLLHEIVFKYFQENNTLVIPKK